MAAEYVQRSSTRIEALTGRVKGLRYAVRFDNFRLNNSFGLAAYLNNLEGLLREEVAPAIEIHRLWLRNVGDRHERKRQAQRQIRRILPGLNGRARSKLERFSQATRLTQSLDHRAPAADRGEPPPSFGRHVR